MKREEMSELQKAKADMDFQRHYGGFGYKQAVAHYKKVLRKEREKNMETDCLETKHNICATEPVKEVNGWGLKITYDDWVKIVHFDACPTTEQITVEIEKFKVQGKALANYGD